MKHLVVFFALIYAVCGRNLHNLDENQNEELEDKNDFIKNIRDQASSQMRHRRKARRTYYDYLEPSYEFRDYSHRQEDTLNKIERLLDEISWYVRRQQAPPPPVPQPQIVYVPYPVPYPVPQYIESRFCTNSKNLTVRWPVMDDSNQNWGLVPGDTGKDVDDKKDGARPVSFDVISPEEPIPKPPPVEHGSAQAGMETTTHAAEVKTPGICQAAIILCCTLETYAEQQNCFQKYRCPKTFATGLSCKPEVVKNVFKTYEESYALNKN